jgi:hypothetical protein
VPPERGDRVRLAFPPEACIGLADIRADIPLAGPAIDATEDAA